MNALTINNLSKTYPPNTQALKDVSLEVKEGDFFGLLGHNGAGKSTLISIVAGLTNKTSGDVHVFDANPDKELVKAKSYIGLVPQEFNFNIFDPCIETVANQAGYYGIPRKEAKVQAEMYLKELGLWDKKDIPAIALSGGMKRRLMIARALVHKPKLFILDEPTAGVDVELRRGMWDFLQKLNKEGTTIILTTHYLEEAEYLCNSLAIINKGSVIAKGNKKELLSQLDTETIVCDIDKPHTEKLLTSLKEFEAKATDQDSIEIKLKKGLFLDQATKTIADQGFHITSIRNKTNRLEELFISLTEK